MSEIILIDINCHTGAAPAVLRYATQGYVTPAPRTNKYLWSGDKSNAAWSKGNSTISAGSGTSPLGVPAQIFTATNTFAQLLPTAAIAATAGDVVMVWHEVRANSGSLFTIVDETLGASYAAQFNLSTGTVSGQAGGSASIVNKGAGWYVCAFTYTVPSGKTSVSPKPWIGTYSGTNFAGQSVDLGASQLEAGAFVSGYIPTTSAPVTVPTPGQENLYYEGRIKQPGNIQRTVFDKATTFGASKVGYGEVVLVNNDGALDAFLTYGFAGFGITIQRGVMLPNMSVPTWTTVLTGTMDSVDFSWGEVSIKVRDRQQELTKPLQATRYGGTNSLPNGLDGVATDIKGNGLPVLYGKAFNFAPPLVNTTRLIYQISEGVIQSIDAVYDKGTALTAGAAYVSQADMETNAPTAGQYRAWLNAAGSYIRLGSAAGGTVTVDATQGAATANRTAAQLMKQVLLKGGILNADINAADVTALDTACAYECGYWVSHTNEQTGASVLDVLANSAGAFWGVDRLGKFRMARIAAPSSGNSIGTLTAVDIIKIDRVRSSDEGGGVPAWQLKLNYAHYMTVQADLPTAVPATYKGDRAEEWRTVVANDAAIKTQWPKAVEITMDTHLVSATDAATEATHRLGLYKVRRDTLQARVKLPDALAASIDLGATVVVQVPRFGMSAGKAYLVTGIRTDLRNNFFDLTLWG